jgi:hypothetical protein
LAITLLGALAWAPAVSAWAIGKPIVTYWDGPGVLDDRVANQAVNGGFNLVWVHSLAELNLAQEHGLRGLLYGSLDDATIAQGHAWADVTLPQGGGVLVGLTSVVPEPSATMLLGTALAAITALRRSMRK